MSVEIQREIAKRRKKRKSPSFRAFLADLSEQVRGANEEMRFAGPNPTSPCDLRELSQHPLSMKHIFTYQADTVIASRFVPRQGSGEDLTLTEENLHSRLSIENFAPTLPRLFAFICFGLDRRTSKRCPGSCADSQPGGVSQVCHDARGRCGARSQAVRR